MDNARMVRRGKAGLPIWLDFAASFKVTRLYSVGAERGWNGSIKQRDV